MQSEIKSYFKMPEASLLALTKLDSKKSIDIELKITESWIKNKKCVCAENPNIQNKIISLDCEHINKVKEEQIRDIEKRLAIKSEILLFKRMRNAFGHSEEQDGKY